MNNRGNTNLRYHIFKELNRYLESKKESDSGAINAFVLPVFSGILSTLIATWIQQDGGSLSNKVLTVIVFIVSFFLLYSISNYLARNINQKIFPIICRQNKKRKHLSTENAQVERAAKINYEVAYLVSLANSYISEETNDSILKKYNLAEAAFHTSTALRKINEALFASSERVNTDKLSNSRIEAIMLMISVIIAKLDSFDDESLRLDMISRYNQIIGFLKTMYSIELAKL